MQAGSQALLVRHYLRPFFHYVQVGHGSLYPALQRLLKLDLIVAEDGTSDNNRKARFYRLIAKGRGQLFVETSKWQRFSNTIAR